MIAFLLLTLAQAAEPTGGLEWRPLSRGDLAWLDSGATSGTGVGEFDGLLRPAVQGWAGAWITERVSLTGTLGIARRTNTTQVDKAIRQRHWGVVRPGLDLRWALMSRRERAPYPWLILGGYGDIPSVRDLSNGYTKQEQKAADEQAAIERSKLGGIGARVGIGAEYDLLRGLAIGGMWTTTWHQSTWRADDLNQVSSWVGADASLLLSFRWPRPSGD